MKTAALVFVTALALSAAPVRPVPPPGVPVSDQDRAQIETGLKRLSASIAELKGVAVLPDVQIFHEAVRFALLNNEFLKPEDVGRAKELLRHGQSRADDLKQGRAPWTTATGLVVRGYVSRIDGSVQPYGIVVPASYSPSLPWRWRLDTWFRGRQELIAEVGFLDDRMRNPGEFAPPNTFVLHPFGRYCNANKFAGEIDLFEALEAVKKGYPIDDSRIVVRGFSMGGAAAWHIAAHYPGEWAAAAPGAGFSETPEFLRIKPEDLAKIPWWEQKLWRLYNATDYAANFFNLPVVAYSGEIDRQKQAADVMARHLTEEGLTLRHVIGPQTPHRYHPDSKLEINRLIDPIAARGRNPYPKRVRFTTWTLRYNRMKWVVIDALDRHWERARIDAEAGADGREIRVRTSNVREFHLEMGAGADLIDPASGPAVVIDGQKLTAKGPLTDGSWAAAFRRDGTRWIAAGGRSDGVRKRHGLQGPIDDAFMDSFIFVVPSGESSSWVKAEQERAIRDWRRQWRGDARVKRDEEITEADIAGNNLVLWGDPAGNRLLAKIADRLPVRWSGDSLTLGTRKFSANSHVPVLIYPNPLNPERYVVLNSGPTQREIDYLNNARQVPRLPDYAIVDTTVPPDENGPGRIVAAGFFGEDWALQPDDGEGRLAR
jgi:hypothetical protein